MATRSTMAATSTGPRRTSRPTSRTVSGRKKSTGGRAHTSGSPTDSWDRLPTEQSWESWPNSNASSPTKSADSAAEDYWGGKGKKGGKGAGKGKGDGCARRGSKWHGEEDCPIPPPSKGHQGFPHEPPQQQARSSHDPWQTGDPWKDIATTTTWRSEAHRSPNSVAFPCTGGHKGGRHTERSEPYTATIKTPLNKDADSFLPTTDEYRAAQDNAVKYEEQQNASSASLSATAASSGRGNFDFLDVATGNDQGAQGPDPFFASATPPGDPGDEACYDLGDGGAAHFDMHTPPASTVGDPFGVFEDLKIDPPARARLRQGRAPPRPAAPAFVSPPSVPPAWLRPEQKCAASTVMNLPQGTLIFSHGEGERR